MTKSAKPLAWILIATVLAVNAFVFALLAYKLIEDKDQQEREVRTAAENMALLLDHNISEAVSKIDLSLREIADDLERTLRDRGRLAESDVNALLARRNALISAHTKIRVTDDSGTVRYGPRLTTDSRLSIAYQDFFAVHRQRSDSGLIVSGLIQGRTLKNWLISFSRRYNYPDGRFAGVISLAAPPPYFARFLSGLDVGPHGVAVLRDSAMAVIARYPPVAALSQQPGSKIFSKEVADIVASGAVAGTYHTLRTADGTERINAYRRLSSLPIHLIAGMAAEDYLAPWRDALKKGIVIAAIFLLFTTALAGLLWRSFRSADKASARSLLLLQNASDGIHIMDRHGVVFEASDSFCRMLGYSRTEVIGMGIPQWDARIKSDELEQTLRRRFDRRAIATFETVYRRKDGSLFDVEITNYPIQLEGQPVIYGSARDITERKRSEAWLRRLSQTVEQSPEAIVITDLGARIEYVNAALIQTTGYSRDELIGENPRILQSGRTPPATYEAMWQGLLQGQSWKGLFFNKRKDGTEYIEFAIITPLRRPDGTITHYVAVKEDVTEKKRQAEELDQYRDHLEELVANRTRELSEARELAEAASQAKTSFLTNMSHEIRTPLNAVLGLARIGMRDGAGSIAGENFGRICRAGEHLLHVINDILDISKIEAGKLMIENRPFELRVAIAGVLSFFAEPAKAKGLTLTVSLAPDLPHWVHGDGLRLAQILTNLLANALKFTAAGEVKLAVARDGEGISFAVIDSGIGISEEQLARLFQPFEQADGSITRNFGGTGLGLAISRNLARLMDGDIEVTSRIDAGSSFILRLKLPGVAAPRQELAAPAAAARSLSGMTLLAADDIEMNRLVLEDLLAHEGARVVLVENGQQAIDRVAELGAAAFDLVLMDLQMPVLDGFAATRGILALAPELPVLGLTAHALADERESCLAAGMADVVTKPIDLAVLLATILRLVPGDCDPARPGAAMPEETPRAATATAGSRAGLVDWPALFVRFKGRGEFIRKLAASVRQQHGDTPARLRTAARAGDSEALAFMVHSIKGMSGSLEAHDLNQLSKELEAAARAGEEITPLAIDTFADLLEAVLAELDDPETSGGKN